MTVVDQPVSVRSAQINVFAPVDVAARTSRRRGYSLRAAAVDLVAGVLGAGLATTLRFSDGTEGVYAWSLLVLPAVWMATLALHGLYVPRFLGAGAEEYRRLLNSGLHLGALLICVSYVADLQLSRGFLAVAVPSVTALNLAGRHGLRRWLHSMRQRGLYLRRVVAVGLESDVAQLADRLAADPSHGLRVVAACVPSGSDGSLVRARGIETVGRLEDVVGTVSRSHADTVAVVGSAGIVGDDLRRLAWKLESSGAALIVSPGLVEVGGPRLSIRPAADLSLLHVEHSMLTGSRALAKTTIDRLLAAAALLVLMPLLVAIGAVVRATSPGPAIYRQRRIGARGAEFTMLKFRSMSQDADARRAALLDRSEGNAVMFKLRNDPRVTRVGAVLRRYSLDELPQLVNVLLGQMSLVGPRPPLPEEVATYDDDARRRLRVRPGLTGLWQVSGRSDLSWEESLRLDLRYIDNWSLALDLLIIWKTSRAVMCSSGAY